VSIRQRKAGAGRKSLTSSDPKLREALEKLIEPTTRGDPMRPLRWTCKSTERLAKELTKLGHSISARSVAALLDQMDYSLQANRKVKEGRSHPDTSRARPHGLPPEEKVSVAQLSEVQIPREAFHGEWNYSIAPHSRKVE